MRQRAPHKAHVSYHDKYITLIVGFLIIICFLFARKNSLVLKGQENIILPKNVGKHNLIHLQRDVSKYSFFVKKNH